MEEHRSSRGVTAARRLEWDSGHRVLRHESKCRTLHGHRYAAEVVVAAESLDEVGRVVDFGVIKQKVGTWIDDHWDHACLVNKDDTALLDFCYADVREKDARPPYVFPGEPTAENIAKELLAKAATLLASDGVRVIRVVVWETPNCYAEARAV